MDRKTHKNYKIYNSDEVDSKIGLDQDHYTYDKVEVFLDRINKRSGFAIVYYKTYEDGQEIEKQYIPYTETDEELKEFLNNCFTKEMNFHYIDHSHTYMYIHDNKKERNHMDLIYTEYIGGKPKRSSIRILRTNQYAITKLVEAYRNKDSRITTVFDSYSRDPIEPPKRIPRKIMRIQKQTTGMPMPEPKVKLTTIANIEYLARAIKNYVLDKFGLNNRNYEIEQNYHHRSR